MKKWLIRLTVIFVTLGVIVSIATVVLAKQFLTKDYLIEQIEDSIDSRVQIGEVKVDVFSVPARLVIKDLVITERDSYADDKVAHSDRPPLDGGAIDINKAECKLTLMDLLKKRVKVDYFEVDGLSADVVMYEDGSTSLDALFAKPDEDKKEKKEEKKKFNAEDHGDFVTQLDKVKIRNVDLTLTIEKTKLQVIGSDVALTVDDIVIDPNDLANSNEASIDLKGSLALKSTKGKQYGIINLAGPAKVKVFEESSGDLNPDVAFDLAFLEGSYFSTDVPYLDKVWSGMDKLEKLGVSMGEIPEKVTFGRSKRLKGRYVAGLVSIDESLSAVIGDWEMVAREGTWVDSAKETHQIAAELVASEKVSQSVRKRLDQAFGVLPKEVLKVVDTDFTEDWFVDGRLSARITSFGLLSKPKVKLHNEVPDVKKMVKKYAGNKLLDLADDAIKDLSGDENVEKAAGSLLKGLLGGDEEEE